MKLDLGSYGFELVQYGVNLSRMECKWNINSCSFDALVHEFLRQSVNIVNTATDDGVLWTIDASNVVNTLVQVGLDLGGTASDGQHRVTTAAAFALQQPSPHGNQIDGIACCKDTSDLERRVMS